VGATTPAALHHFSGNWHAPCPPPPVRRHFALRTHNTLAIHPPPPPPPHLEAAVVACRGLVPRPAAQPLRHQPVLQPKHLHQGSRQLLVPTTGPTPTPTSIRPCAAPSSSSCWRGAGGGIAGGSGRRAGAEGGLAAAFPGGEGARCGAAAGCVPVRGVAWRSPCQLWCVNNNTYPCSCTSSLSPSPLSLHPFALPLIPCQPPSNPSRVLQQSHPPSAPPPPPPPPRGGRPLQPPSLMLQQGHCPTAPPNPPPLPPAPVPPLPSLVKVFQQEP
jgi:hypothetical protein